MTIGEKWLYEVRLIHDIVVLPTAIFQGGKRKNTHSLTKTIKITYPAYPDKNYATNTLLKTKCVLIR